MIKFKRFQGFKRKTTDIDNVNVQDGGTPQATVGTTASIGEQLATACQTPAAQYSIGIHDDGVSAKAKLPFKLKLSKKEADELEKNIENSLELILKPYFVKENIEGERHVVKRSNDYRVYVGDNKKWSSREKDGLVFPDYDTAMKKVKELGPSKHFAQNVHTYNENEDDQELEAHPKPRKGFMKKATNAPLPTDRHQIATIVSGDGTIGLSEDCLWEGAGTHEYVDHVHPDHEKLFRDHPEGFDRKHSYTDTTMRYTRAYRRPQPVHTHHMVVTLK